MDERGQIWAWWQKRDEGTRGVLGVLVALSVGCLVVLFTLELPWAGEAAARTEAGKEWRVKDFATVYGWWAALINLALLVGTLACFRWLNGDATKLQVHNQCESSGRLPPWFWGGLLIVVILAGSWRLPRLDHSFHNDEEYAFRSYSWGKFEISEMDEGEEKWVFDPHTPVEKFFRNKTGNNHVVHTVEANAGLAIWRLWSGAGENEFSEAFVRLFPFLSGFGTIVMAGIVGAMIGGPACGLGTALLLALSPWHVRYSVEARGYSTMLLAMMISLGCLFRALDTSRWPMWLGFGLAQAVYLLSFAGSIYVAVAMNVGLVLVFAQQLRHKPWSSVPIGRWLIASVVSAVVVIQVMLPAVPQILDYRERTGASRNRSIDWGWLMDYWSHLVAGIPPLMESPARALGLGVDVLQVDLPWVWGAIFVVAPLLVLIGTVGAVRSQGIKGGLVVVSLWGGAALAVLHNGVGNSEMYGWYLIYTVPVFALSLSTAAASLAKWSPRAGVIALLSVTAGYAWMTVSPRESLTKVERQPMRTVVNTVRGDPEGKSWERKSEVLTATFGACDRQIQSYDPQVNIVENLEQMHDLIKEATLASRELYVYFCGNTQTTLQDPELVKLVAHEDHFEHVIHIPGFEAFMSYDVFRLAVVP